MSHLVSRAALAALIVLVSLALHLALLGVILWSERRGATASEAPAIEVELIRPPKSPKVEAAKPEAPAEQPKAEEKRVEQKPAEPSSPASMPAAAQQSASPERQMAKGMPPNLPSPLPSAKPAGPSGGPGEGKSTLTPEEIAAFRAQVQKCWTLPIGVPNATRLETVLRVFFARNGSLTAGPELLKASASAGGPVLVGIAIKALRECAPYRLPAAKYSDWKVMDLRFVATGLAGPVSVKVPTPGRPG